MTTRLSIRRVQLSTFLIAAALIAYQILLMKLFSIQYWHHFAYFIISIALLGFGASGSFIALFRKEMVRNIHTVLFVLPILMIVAMWFNLYLSRAIAFNPMMIVWQKQEAWRLLALSLSLFLPFFLGAICIGLGFCADAKRIHILYFFNMAGSGLGSLIILMSVFHAGPREILLVVSVGLIGASLIATKRPVRRGIAALILIGFIPFYLLVERHTALEVSRFKDLAQAENLTGAKKELERFGPLGLLTVLDSPAFHYLPDLSLNCPHPVPRQKGMFLDGNTIGAITAFGGDPQDARYMGWRTSALAYQLLRRPDVLIVGGGSGTEILNARYHDAGSISVIEMNGDVVRAMQGPYRLYSGGLYDVSKTKVIQEEGRGYLGRSGLSYDLIQISLLESMGAASAGVYAINEDYLFTKEAMRAAMERLKPGGFLSVSRWIRNPPRDAIKLLGMVIEAAEERGKDTPAHSLIMIRSWQTATLLFKNGAFLPSEIETVKAFCRSRLFDVSYFPGVKASETNIFNQMDTDYLHLASVRLLSKDRERFYAEFPFHIKPATDDKPFFSHFFKFSLLKQYLDTANRSLIPFMDWGYIMVWLTGAILCILGVLFILAPVPLLRYGSRGFPSVLFYFGCLGAAYMFLEIALLQQFTRYLYDPVFSASVVIGSFLFFSGIGSLAAGSMIQISPRQMAGVVMGVVIMGIVLMTSDLWLQKILAGWPLWMRMISCSLIIAPLAMFMGVPFPSGLSQLNGEKAGLIPWAWGVNGFFSVIGGSATVLLAMAWGFKAVIAVALLLYVFAGCIFGLLNRRN